MHCLPSLTGPENPGRGSVVQGYHGVSHTPSIAFRHSDGPSGDDLGATLDFCRTELVTGF